MIKGCQKRMIFIKNTGCDLFDEAYFILKNDIPSSEENQNDIIRTATAIINEHEYPLNKRKKVKNKSSKSLVLFLIGALCGAAICALGFIIF
jgi:hypothetical protein